MLALALLISVSAFALPSRATGAYVATAAPLPSSRLEFGLANSPSDRSWMTSSGVPWKYRYQYLTAGVNTGHGWETWNSPPGAFATNYMNDSDSHGYIPVFSYYELLQSLPSTGSTELDRDYNNLNSPNTMNSYYSNFALLMTVAKSFGKPVIVHVEPDLFGYMEHKAAGGDASTVSASVASSGYTGFSNLPNTFQGFCWGLLRLRDTIAPNVILATHASTWASGVDIGLNTDPNFNLAVNADKTAAFLGSAGIAANPFSSTFDVVFNDVSGRWWDRYDKSLPDFQQWLTWMTELHAKTARQLVVWQVPVGNQYFDTMNQSPGHTQDNRAEYFLSHVSGLQAAGIIAVLFGSGYTDAKGDGVTNPPPVSTFECNLCNNHTSVWSDDDGGYLRIFVGQYYAGSAATAPGAPTKVMAVAGDASATLSWLAPLSDGGSAITSYTVTSAPVALSVSVAGGVTSATVPGLADGTSYTFTITATNAVGTSPPSALSNAVVPGRGAYQGLPPARILDTRDGTGGVPVAPIGPGRTLNVQIGGQGPVPATGVSAVVLNVTATDTTAPSYLTVWPAGVPRPLASSLNWVSGQTRANLVEVALGLNGRVSIYNGAGSADVIFDVAGYVATPTAAPPAAGLYTPVVPSRVLDTRTGNGAPQTTPVGQNQTITVQVAGRSGSNVPATGVSAVVLNVTVTNPTSASYLTVFPTGTNQPLASNLNFVVGETVPNRVIVKVGTGGSVSFYNGFGSVDVVADVGGWFTDGTVPMSTGSRFVGVTPARIVDTRDGTGGVPIAPLGPNAAMTVGVAGRGGVPAMTATAPPNAVVLNVTVTGPTAPSYMTVWPNGSGKPLASDLNWVAGLTVPNLVVVKLGSNGTIDLYNAFGSVDTIIDVVGWYG